MGEVSHSIDSELSGQRLDKALSALEPDYSRARLQALIAEGQVRVNGVAVKTSSQKVRQGDDVALSLPPLKEAAPQPQNIALDIVFEDEHLLVIDKPAGLVVHPGAGNPDGTLVNALLYHCGESLSGIGGVRRPGIVHRLDKNTSGLMLAAKSDAAHQGLARQLAERSLMRRYQAVVFGVPFPPSGHVDQMIGRHKTNRLKMDVFRYSGKEAKTHYKVLERFGDVAALVDCKLETGRTHQIRVHMEFLKHPLIGDPLYGPQKNALASALKKSDAGPEIADYIIHFPRQALHAYKLSFIHPVSGAVHSYERDLPEDMSKLLELLGKI